MEIIFFNFNGRLRMDIRNAREKNKKIVGE